MDDATFLDLLMLALVCMLGLSTVSLWVAAWLHWLFETELRQALFAYVLPVDWLSARDPADIVAMSPDEFTIFLNAESDAPKFFQALFSCPACMSNYLSIAGTVILFSAVISLIPAAALLTLPLVWAGGAYVGHTSYRKNA